MTARKGEDLQLTKVVGDREIGNRLYLQAIALSPNAYLGEKRTGLFFQRLLDVMQKLERAKYHADRYQLLVSDAIACAPDVGGVAVHSDQTTRATACRTAVSSAATADGSIPARSARNRASCLSSLAPRPARDLRRCESPRHAHAGV